MIKEVKQVTKNDLLPLEEYSKQRKKLREELIEFKKNRRIHLGPYATFYFECYETMLAQIQEMLFIEKGGDEQLKDELIAYNPLIPQGNELIATLMFEIDNPILRANFLNKVTGIEEKVYMKLNEEKIAAISETDIERTSSEGKVSSVQFLHFNFSEQQIKKFKNLNNEVILGIDHILYNHKTKISAQSRKVLIGDFT